MLTLLGLSFKNYDQTVTCTKLVILRFISKPGGYIRGRVDLCPPTLVRLTWKGRNNTFLCPWN